MNISIIYKYKKEFKYEINVNEQAANKKGRTGYRMK
jgi:hypothetical protein